MYNFNLKVIIMEEYFFIFINSLWQFLNEISIYMVFGLLFAGVLKQLIPENFVKKQLGKNSHLSVLKSAVLGIPLPLCSCSVLPFATALKKDGASKGAVQTFLISTPITGADSILATYGVLGIFFTIYRVVSSIFIALIAGFLSVIFDKEKQIKAPMFSIQKPENFHAFTTKQTPLKQKPFYIRVYEYGFKTLLGDMAKPLLVGVFLATFITTFLPNAFPDFLLNSKILSYLAMLAISLPVYVCATASIPLGISFLVAGFSPGAVLIFLTAGPASNMATIMIVKKLLGKKTLFIYLSSIILGSIFFAYFLDFFFQDRVAHTFSNIHEHETFNLLHVISTILLLGLSFKVIFDEYRGKVACGS